uniref:Tudor-knot domain-containing protein n=1 Tax=Acrobeloides nanus TaxID=290746 RepID=A0A914CZB4_9BILA
MSKKNQKSNESTEPSAEYIVNTAVLCQHKDGLFYEGKIIDAGKTAQGEPLYTVHYQGWNSRYDEKIPQTELRTRLRDYNQENLEKAKVERNEALSRSRKRKAAGAEKGASDSRGSTPSGSDRKSQSRAASQASYDTPGPLKKILQDDSDMINRQFKLPKLPPKATAAEIINQ